MLAAGLAVMLAAELAAAVVLGSEAQFVLLIQKCCCCMNWKSHPNQIEPARNKKKGKYTKQKLNSLNPVLPSPYSLRCSDYNSIVSLVYAVTDVSHSIYCSFLSKYFL